MSKTTEKSVKPNPFKESFRKLIVSLKRKPQNIAMLSLVITFLVYSMNMGDVSETTSLINTSGMGLCCFCTMLFSILSFVCFINAFPMRKKVNIPMLVLMFIMFGAIFFADTFYSNSVMAAVTRASDPITPTPFIVGTVDMLNVHMIWLVITVVLVVTMPIYKKLLRKINTNVDVEDNGKMAAIELSAE